MADTFTPKPGTAYWNLSGPNVGLTGMGTTPIGPSSPGYVQGTANTIPVPSKLQGVLGADTVNSNTYIAPTQTQTQSPAPSSNLDPHINPNTGQWDDNYYAQHAQSGYDATMQAIKDKLGLVRQQASDMISNAANTRDYLTNFIQQRYPELQNRVKQQQTTANQGFDTQQTDLQNLYDQANAKARRASEDAALQNRMSARAGNRLGSSFYDQLVNSNNENLGRTLGASDLEKISKLAALNTQRTSSDQNYTNTSNDLNTQANQATYQALDDYKKAVQQSDYLNQAGLNDFGASSAQAADNLNSRLDAINQWAQGMAQQKQLLNARYGNGGGFDTTLSGFNTNNTNFLNNNASTPAGSTALAYTPTTMGTPTPTNSNSTLANILALSQQKKPINYLTQ